MVRGWRTVGKSRVEKFKEQKRTEWQEEIKNKWLRGDHRNIRTHIFYGRSRQSPGKRGGSILEFGG